ncbi:MAG: DUF4432 family protein, partial [Leptolyngbyaceae cyanobacterium bins.59]|nr:DUF4432 family protein [Leptolyngbyaceae cyanobacterium bins.59]
SIEYFFENQSRDRIPFLLKQHAAIVIEAGDEILLPDCMIEPVALEFSKLIGQPGKSRFPSAIDANGKKIQINTIPPASSQLQEFYYCSELAIGECGIRNQATQSALKMKFDSADFPYVWVFQSYGGWKNHYVLVMEPATTIPYDLEVACQNGTVAYLEPDAIQQRRLRVCLER